MITVKEIGKEAKETYNAIMQERGMFSTNKQWNYYLTEIVNQLMREVSTNLWEESDNEEKEMAKIYNEDMFPDCPVYDLSCPYLGSDGKCMMFKEENVLPYDECDAFYGMEEEEEEE